jgi:hypothetical protein
VPVLGDGGVRDSALGFDLQAVHLPDIDFVSYGCIRMYNADVLDLYNRVSWGAPVIVTR